MEEESGRLQSKGSQKIEHDGVTKHTTQDLAAAKSLQSCPTPRDPIDGSLPGPLVLSKITFGGLPWWLPTVKTACNAGDTGDADAVPGSERSPGEGNGYLLQYSCLDNSMDRGAWWASLWGHKESQLSNNKV